MFGIGQIHYLHNMHIREYLPVLKGADESGMIGENIEGFISCMGSGVRGVSDPPAMTMLRVRSVINRVN